MSDLADLSSIPKKITFKYFVWDFASLTQRLEVETGCLRFFHID